MRGVAKNSGIATGTVFNYFADKLELLHATLEADLDAVAARCIATLEEVPTSVEDDWSHVAGCFFEYFLARPDLSRALLERSLFATGPAGERFRAQVEALGEVMGARVRTLQEGGQISSRADPNQVVAALLAHYYFVLQLGLNGAIELDRMRGLIEALVGQLVLGIGRRKDT